MNLLKVVLMLYISYYPLIGLYVLKLPLVFLVLFAVVSYSLFTNLYQMMMYFRKGDREREEEGHILVIKLNMYGLEGRNLLFSWVLSHIYCCTSLIMIYFSFSLQSLNLVFDQNQTSKFANRLVTVIMSIYIFKVKSWIEKLYKTGFLKLCWR